MSMRSMSSTPPTRCIWATGRGGDAHALSPHGGRETPRAPRSRLHYAITRHPVWPSPTTPGWSSRKTRRRASADMLDPKWKGKIVKAHPAYAGNIMNATFQVRARARLGISREAREAEDAAGPVVDRPAEEDRAGRARHEGRRQRVHRLRIENDAGEPIQVLYPTEGTPFARPLGRGQRRAQPERGAAVLELMLYRAKASSSVSTGRLRSVHSERQGPESGRVRSSEIKLLNEDHGPSARTVDEIKRRYAQISKVAAGPCVLRLRAARSLRMRHAFSHRERRRREVRRAP